MKMGALNHPVTVILNTSLYVRLKRVQDSEGVEDFSGPTRKGFQD